MRTSSYIFTALLLSASASACASNSETDRPGGDTSNATTTGAGGGTTGSTTGPGLSTTDGGIIGGGKVENPCEGEEAPEECELVASGPACGDGKQNQDSEECDDGNSLPGDGCSGTCLIEAYHECPTAGEPCVSTILCGDGVLGPGEACDDANTADGDGCSARCNLVENGFSCPEAGIACTKIPYCGDGLTDSNEGCDDGNRDSGDGCSDRCRLELGFKCEGEPSVCTATVCGDGVQEGAESCDDGNAVPFDGCSADCRAEPGCRSGACTSVCGDGIVLNEECDDGNLREGDGCSSSCTLEEGFVCEHEAGICSELAEGEPCTLVVPVVFRDFNANHSDFEPGTPSSGQLGLVSPMLDDAGKPEFSGDFSSEGHIASAASFADWYSDTSVSATIVDELVLWDNDAGGYVNRWGPSGEQWLGPAAYTDVVRCGDAGSGCGEDTECGGVLADGATCFDPCLPWNETEENANNSCAAVLEQQAYDGEPMFFPIDNHPEALTQPAAYSEAKVPAQYGYIGWPWETDEFPDAPLHNFHFTTEVRYWFQYAAGQTVRLDFTGDDDVWVFVNNRLALDLGGWHEPQDGTVTINAQSAGTYELSDGSVYEIAIFHAERQTEGSSFRLTLSGFNLAPSFCEGLCGDGIVGPGEECDDGSNAGEYAGCTSECKFGPRCGDGILQDQFGELCDDGINDGAYGGCAPSCALGPHCGDAVVQADFEQCDDGLNDGGYGECSAGCVLGPYCGDGNISVGIEDCDDGGNEDGDGCSGACKLEVTVPK